MYKTRIISKAYIKYRYFEFFPFQKEILAKLYLYTDNVCNLCIYLPRRNNIW